MDIGLISAFGLAIIDAITHHHNEIIYFIKDLVNFYYYRDKEIFIK